MHPTISEFARSLPLAVVLFDSEGRPSEWNASAVRMVSGYGSDGSLASIVRALGPEGIELLQKVAREGRDHLLEIPAINSDPHVRIRLTAHPLPDGGGYVIMEETSSSPVARVGSLGEISLQVLLDISSAAIDATDLEDLCIRIYKALGAIVDTSNFYIGVLDGAGNFRVPYQHDEDEYFPVLPVEILERSLTGIVLKTGEVLHLNEEDLNRLDDGGDVDCIGKPALSWLGIPLKSDGKVTGAFVVQDYQESHHFRNVDVQYLVIVARQISLAVSRQLHDEDHSRQQQELSLIFEQSPLALIGWDTEFRVTRWNPAAESIFGYSAAEAMGRSAKELIIPAADMEYVDGLWERLLAGEGGRRGHNRNRTKDGKFIICNWYNVPLTDKAGKTIGVASLAENITERVSAEEALRESEQRYALAVLGANDGIWDWDLTDDTVYYSDRWKSQIGMLPHEIGCNPQEWFERVHPDDREMVQEILREHIVANLPLFECEHRILHRDGGYRWVLSRGLAVRSDRGVATRIAGSQTDITARREAEARVSHAARHDPLTGIPNRFLFLERLNQTIHRCRMAPGTQFALLFLDLDGFKAINDRFGHLYGDELLGCVARRLEVCLRTGDLLARMGGDEFVALLEGVKGQDGAAQIASRIVEEVSRPYDYMGQTIEIGCSIGIVLSDGHEDDPVSLVARADKAMYQAKNSGKGGFVHASV